MKVRTTICALFILLAIIKAEEVAITGVIQDTANAPIKKAAVTLLNLRNAVLAEESTNRKGEFAIKDIEPFVLESMNALGGSFAGNPVEFGADAVRHIYSNLIMEQ